MKTFINIFITLTIFYFNPMQAQNNNYKSLWSQVEKFESESLPKSALSIVSQIETKATAENNEVQLIKTLLFKSKFALILEEDAQLKVVNDFKKHIEQSQGTNKNVLHNMLAKLYWDYFQSNRYTFYNRTKTENKVDSTDFRTWDLETLFTEIGTHFETSLDNETLLQNTSLESFEPILISHKESKILRPTLYDFLAHNALAFYKTPENSITKPTYAFKMDDASYFKDFETFKEVPISSKDTASLELKALKLYQKLINFHALKNNEIPLAAVDVERLLFLKNKGTLANSDTLFLTALHTGESQVNLDNAKALYTIEIAYHLYQQGQNYDPDKNTQNRWKFKEALSICDKLIKEFPESYIATRAQNLKATITQPSLQLQVESYLPIQSDSRILVKYRNVKNVQFSVFKISEKESEKLRTINDKEDKRDFIENCALIKKWIAPLKNEGDYRNHSTEILLPSNSQGRFIILAAPPESDNNRLFEFTELQYTNLAIVKTQAENETILQVVNRTNGNPVVNATCIVIEQGKTSNKTTCTTDTKGQIKVPVKNDNYYQYTVKVSHEKDNASFGKYYKYRNYHYEKQKNKSFLFTDRSIYRPGQTLYFKGIVIQTENEKSSVVPNESVLINMRDANGDDAGELELKTNEYGTVTGEFIIPTGRLTGTYYLELASNSSKSYSNTYRFNVEEYKRPKFETNFKPITETYRLNDDITITGEALSYAGSKITNAQVSYKVTRKVQYPRWYYWGGSQNYGEGQEITFGETTTNDKGEYSIDFKALPDESVDKTGQPVFNYEVTADVTDINGETQSTTTTVHIGYHALTIGLQTPQKIDKQDKNQVLKINTKNLNGEKVSAEVTVKLLKLKAPKRVTRPRPWNAPDYQEFSEAEFATLFPHDSYTNKNNVSEWEEGAVVFSKKINTNTTEKEGELNFGNIKKLESGAYVVIAMAKDKFGQEVLSKSYTSLFSETDKTPSDNGLFDISLNQETYSPGDKAAITLKSNASITVTVSIEKNKKIIDSQIITLNKNSKTIQTPVTTEDIGGFAVHYSFTSFNSYQGGTLSVAVPAPSTELSIETKTFRDKLAPDVPETWSFKIKGPDGEKVSAELLASMYDVSLDQFKPHNWSFNPQPDITYQAIGRPTSTTSFGNASLYLQYGYHTYYNQNVQNFDQFNWFGLSLMGQRIYLERKTKSNFSVTAAVTEISAEEMNYGIDQFNSSEDNIEGMPGVHPNNEIVTQDSTSVTTPDLSQVSIRKNLQETAFFFPQLKTDADGSISFSFTTPEALTRWKLQLLAHTKDLKTNIKTLEAVTQKELMVVPNAPRFLREGDAIIISSKISNLSESNLTGKAILQLSDAITGKPIDIDLNNVNSTQDFSVAAKNNTQVSWRLNIPLNIKAVQYKVIAQTEKFSDGEQNTLPVLSNRMLVTETLPMWVRSNESKTFTLDKLKNNTSTTLKHHKLTLEVTSNPAWYAVQALPYLMEYPYDCNEQTFARYYANTLASHIANSNPRIQAVFNQWKNSDALLSNLEKNEDLKSLLIQETPWIRDAQSEAEQKKRIALLFDLNVLQNKQDEALSKLKQNQMNSGAWPWFNGGFENRFITQHIVSGFGHLSALNVLKTDADNYRDEDEMIRKAIAYLDNKFVEEYEQLSKYTTAPDYTKDHLSAMQTQYLYMRSFFPKLKKSAKVEKISKYYLEQMEQYWTSRNLYSKGMIALVLHRNGNTATAQKITKSLKENSITSEELGMYWKSNTPSWYWYQAPIETQALMIEVFSEIENDITTVDNLKVWLLKNKQTNQWSTTKATSEAVYALLLQGTDWLSVTDAVNVTVGDKVIDPSSMDAIKVEAGTGYFKTSYNTSEIDETMATVTMQKKGEGIAWGGLYWQYFEDLDKITTAETPLQLKKKLFLKKNTATGEELSEITEETALKVGDLVRVRIELRSDREMDFVHMKDMRAAGLEPIDVISTYKYQDGLGYYQATKDASTNFFFDTLRKGIYVFEYDLRVNNAGTFSNGITTIQSMYAPEFSSHSEGVRINVE
ncbi:hypothetical protein SCB49_04135 [unidentified eubacterium SCB49]|nr:hypothetical protein SCB49_04135 [unidentified eubacterium SCB49]